MKKLLIPLLLVIVAALVIGCTAGQEEISDEAIDAELEQLSLAEGELVIVSRREKNISIKILIVDDESHYGNQIYAN